MSKKQTTKKLSQADLRKRKTVTETRGRKSEYTQEIGDSICVHIATGHSVISWCKQNEYCITTIYNWLNKGEDIRDRDFLLYQRFVKQYARAREDSGDYVIEQIKDLTEELETYILSKSVSNWKASAYISALKLKIDSLKWYASKMKPKKYGDKIDVTSDNKAVKMNVLWLGGKQPTTDNG